MKPEQIIEALEAACGQLAIAVRYETMTGEISGAGGLCKVKGEWRVIIDRKLNTSDRAAVLVDALAQFDTDNVFLPPQLREAVQARRGGPAPRSGSESEQQPPAEQQATQDPAAQSEQSEAMPADEATPAESAPAVEPAPAAESAPAVEPAPAAESAPAAEPGRSEPEPDR